MTLSDPRDGAVERGSDVTTLRHLVDAIGAPILHVLVAPRGLGSRVRVTVLHDPIDELLSEPDAVLLLAGSACWRRASHSTRAPSRGVGLLRGRRQATR